MNTPAHLLLGAAAFGRPDQSKITLAAIIGALLPDASLYAMAGTSLFVLGISPQRVFGELYFSDAWQTVFAIDNSFIVWGLLLIAALMAKKAWAVALVSAALLHIALDFPLHHDDGRPHFWPLSNWVFESPISYWDRAQGARIVAPLELVAAMAAAVLILWRGYPRWVKALTLVLAAAQLWIGYQWLFVFEIGA